MNKSEIIAKLQVPGLYMGDYMKALDGLKRSWLMELARDIDAPIRADYSNEEIKKSIVLTFMLPRHLRKVREMAGVKFVFEETIDDIETAIERRGD